MQFVNGNGSKPKTVISKTHTESSANKPIVRGQQKSVQKIRIDSGADINAIDASAFRNIKALSKTEIHYSCTNSTLKCANG